MFGVTLSAKVHVPPWYAVTLSDVYTRSLISKFDAVTVTVPLMFAVIKPLPSIASVSVPSVILFCLIVINRARFNQENDLL